MKRRLVLCVVGALLAVAPGCKGKAFVLRSIEAKVDGGVAKDERNGLMEDASRLVDLKLSGIDADSPFAQIFGGTTNVEILKYLDTRVNYILGRKASLRGLLVPMATNKETVQTIATNIGVGLWLAQETQPNQRIGVKAANEVVPLNSSRVGIVQLGNVFGSMPSIARLETLVHEARHSDCTGGITRTEIRTLLSGGDLQNRSCGHMHVICPAGHEYAGYAACDGQAWGAYAVGAAYAAVVSQQCTNCVEREKQIGMALAVDSLSRVLVLQDMLAGRLGKPDMTSAGVRD